MSVYATANSVNFTTSSLATNFITTKNTFNTGSGTYALTDEDSLEIVVTYNFEGILVLPKSEQLITVQLKTLNEEIGNIKQSFTFNTTSTSAYCRFRVPPTTSSVENFGIGPKYYYESPPKQIYVTSSVDNGFSSGSGFKQNWYFERGNTKTDNTGSQFTLMTASYDLSKLWYNTKVNTVSPYYGNSFMQVLSTQSVLLGYQPITEYFNPKKGDLIRLFNHDSEEFIYSSTFEREIVNIIEPQTQDIGSGSNGVGSYANRLVFEVSNVPNSTDLTNIQAQSCYNNPTGSVVGHILNFIFLSKIPDETNIVINHPKRPGQTSAGMVIPENINKDLKREAGNIIKGLKSQNLI